jgi:hypothetical protein
MKWVMALWAWLKSKWEARRLRGGTAPKEAQHEGGALAGALHAGRGDETETSGGFVDVGAASRRGTESHETALVNPPLGGESSDAEWDDFLSDPRQQARFRAAWERHERAKKRGEVP